MTRLAPSASNKQPWRIVKSGNDFHFFEYRTPGHSVRFEYDIQRIDMGIAACHFHLAAIEKDLRGEIKALPTPDIKPQENLIYAFSWIKF